MRRPTGTLTSLPGVAKSSQPNGTISGRCQESNVMNYEYPGDVDRMAVEGREEEIPLFPVAFYAARYEVRLNGLCSSSERLISKSWVYAKLGVLMKLWRSFPSWRACLTVEALRLTLIALMTSSSASPGWSAPGFRQLGTMSRRGRHEAPGAPDLCGR